MRALSVYCFLIKYQTKQKHLFKKTDCNTKIGEIQNKITTDHAKYITTQEFSKLTSEYFGSRLRQPSLANKNDIAHFVKNRCC